ncbi:MAG: hypothetical protein ACM3U2_04530 [Deltaproteobacteria bacterium]
MEERSFIVPDEMAEEAEAVVRLLKEAARAQRLGDEVSLRRPEPGEPGQESLTAVVLFIGASTAGWLTKEWLETYLWPLIRQRIDAPSRRFVDWLNDRLP